jgi:hypothetical protein
MLTPTNTMFPEYLRRVQQTKAVTHARAIAEKLAAASTSGKAFHHIFPQEFRDEFERMGIDIDQYTIPLDPEIHRIIHSGGWYNGVYHDMYNDEWGMWINEGGETAEEAGKFAAEILSRLGLIGEEYPIVPYPKPPQ